jgi:PKHD-type hydroxylase
MAFYIFPNAIPKKECKRLLNYCLKHSDFEDASVINKGYADVSDAKVEEKSRTDHEMRKTAVSFITDKDNMMNEIVWGFIRQANAEFFNYKLEYFQPIQFARYRDGGHYDWHQDSSPHDLANEGRKLSLTMSLTDHDKYDGGLLQFYNGDKPYEDKYHDIEKDIKSVGSVIVFDSRDWHRVTPVTKGVRYSIVCWTIGPNFI